MTLSFRGSWSCMNRMFFPARTRITLYLQKLFFYLKLFFVFCLYEYFMIDKEWNSHPRTEKQEQYGRTSIKNWSLQDRKQYNNKGSEYPINQSCEDIIRRFNNLWNVSPKDCPISDTKCESEHYETYKNEDESRFMCRI